MGGFPAPARFKLQSPDHRATVQTAHGFPRIDGVGCWREEYIMANWGFSSTFHTYNGHRRVKVTERWGIKFTASSFHYYFWFIWSRMLLSYREEYIMWKMGIFQHISLQTSNTVHSTDSTRLPLEFMVSDVAPSFYLRFLSQFSKVLPAPDSRHEQLQLCSRSHNNNGGIISHALSLSSNKFSS